MLFGVAGGTVIAATVRSGFATGSMSSRRTPLSSPLGISSAMTKRIAQTVSVTSVGNDCRRNCRLAVDVGFFARSAAIAIVGCCGCHAGGHKAYGCARRGYR